MLQSTASLAVQHMTLERVTKNCYSNVKLFVQTIGKLSGHAREQNGVGLYSET